MKHIHVSIRQSTEGIELGKGQKGGEGDEDEGGIVTSLRSPSGVGEGGDTKEVAWSLELL